MTLDLTLTTLSNGPEAIGRDPATGRAVFVPFAIPGETVRVDIVEAKPAFARARLVEILSPSPDRVAPACRHFGECGGCHYQHMSYAAQLKWKRQVVVDQLARIGGIAAPNVLEAVPSPDPFHYRNHVQFAQTPEGRLGFVGAGRRAGLGGRAEPPLQVIPISECPITRPELMELFAQLDLEKLDVDRVSVRVGAEGDAMLIFESESGQPPDVELDLPISVASVGGDGRAFTLIGDDFLAHEILGRSFRVSPASFFQVNTRAAEKLVGLALEALAPGGGDTVLDLYCGVGLFAAFIAPRAARLIGVESFPPAVRDAEVNLDEFDNVELYESPVEDALAHLIDRRTLSSSDQPVKVILDPPRAGCDKAVIQPLLAIGPQRIVYVSCDPATLARDARRLAGGGYRLLSAQPLDMFPQTHHIETVAVFQK